jgi:hypothetical protein
VDFPSLELAFREEFVATAVPEAGTWPLIASAAALAWAGARRRLRTLA